MSEARADILVRISSDVTQLRQAIAEMKNAEGGMTSLAEKAFSFGAGLGVFTTFKNSISGLFGETIAKGIETNKTLETMQVSIAAMLRNFSGDQFKSFNSAMAGSGDLLQRIRVRANELGLSFEELADTYKTTAGVFYAAGITDTKKQLDLVVMLQKAMQSLGVSGFQATRDIQDILTGMAQRTKAGRELGLSDEAIKSAREAGTLFEYLTDRLRGFNEAAGESANTMQAVENRLHNAEQSTAAEATKELSSAYKELLVSITGLVSSDAFKQLTRALADDLAGLTRRASSFAKWFASEGAKSPASVTRKFQGEAAGIASDAEGVESTEQARLVQRRAFDKIRDVDWSIGEADTGTVVERERKAVIASLYATVEKLEKDGDEIIAKNKAKAAAAAQQAKDNIEGDKISKDRDAQKAADSANLGRQIEIEKVTRAIQQTEAAITREKEKQAREATAKSNEAQREQARKDNEAAQKTLEAAEISRRQIENNVYLTDDQKREALRQALI